MEINLTNEGVKFLVDNLTNENVTFHTVMYLQVKNILKFEKSNNKETTIKIPSNIKSRKELTYCTFNLSLSDSTYYSNLFYYQDVTETCKLSDNDFIKITKIEYKKGNRMFIEFDYLAYNVTLIGFLKELPLNKKDKIKLTVEHQFNKKVDNTKFLFDHGLNNQKKEQLYDLCGEVEKQILNDQFTLNLGNDTKMQQGLKNFINDTEYINEPSKTSQLSYVKEYYVKNEFIKNFKLTVVNSTEDENEQIIYILKDECNYFIQFIQSKHDFKKKFKLQIGGNYKMENVLINYTRTRGFYLTSSFLFNIGEMVLSKLDESEVVNINTLFPHFPQATYSSVKSLKDKILLSSKSNYFGCILVKGRFSIENNKIIYLGCTECFKKDCTIHNNGSTPLYYLKGKIEDDSDKLDVTFFGENAIKIMTVSPLDWENKLDVETQTKIYNKIHNSTYFFFIYVSSKLAKQNFKIINLEVDVEQD